MSQEEIVSEESRVAESLMDEAFKVGDRARFAIPDGARVVVVAVYPRKHYLVRTVPDGREVVAAESELEPLEGGK